MLMKATAASSPHLLPCSGNAGLHLAGEVIKLPFLCGADLLLFFSDMGKMDNSNRGFHLNIFPTVLVLSVRYTWPEVLIIAD